jgi:tRNA(Ile)-lysidine synthase
VLSEHRRVVLAVSGGIDSMVLLDAAASTAVPCELLVATFDHGTGRSATKARKLVEARGAHYGLEVVSGRATVALPNEGAFRHVRWRFLDTLATSRSGRVATAHTRDDHVETVLMRIMRGTGARGLAALYASSRVLRPFLQFTRSEIVEYAGERKLEWIEDPTNASRRFFRNRVRHDLLPALRRVRPSIDAELLDVSRRAAEWRNDVERFVSSELSVVVNGRGSMDVATRPLQAFTEHELRLLWPAIAARVGLTLDRRSIQRVAAFTCTGRVGSRIPVVDGWQIIRSRDAFQVRASPAESGSMVSLTANGAVVGEGRWSFRLADRDRPNDLWSAWLPLDAGLSVRPWLPGDNMAVARGEPARKVKRLLSRAGITGHDRQGWPVVLAGNEIVWIPGVRRADAASARSGRPGLPFVCEFHRR